MHQSTHSRTQGVSSPLLALSAGVLIGAVGLLQFPTSRFPQILALLPFGAALLAGFMKSGTA